MTSKLSPSEWQGTFSEKKAAQYFRIMVEVIHHCHQLGVIHRWAPDAEPKAVPALHCRAALCCCGHAGCGRPCPSPITVGAPRRNQLEHDSWNMLQGHQAGELPAHHQGRRGRVEGS